MKYNKIFVGLFVLLLLFNSIPLNAQKYGVTLDGGRFMWKVEPKNSQARWDEYRMNAIYPADFRKDPGYTNLLHGGIGMYSIDQGHPWTPSNAAGVLKSGPSGGVTAGDQNKTMRYPYPVITVDGENAGRYQDPEFIVDPTLEYEMVGHNRARSLMGITCYSTTYSWSHPDYQEIIIQHDHYVNDGNWFKHWDPPNEDTVDVNTYPEFFIHNHRWYMGGYKSEVFPKPEGTSGPDRGIFETNWNFWGYGVTDGVTDPKEVMMYEFNPDQREASPLEDEGEWNIEDHRFWYPYYFGFGYLDASGPLMEHPKVTSPLHWWGMESYPHNLGGTNQTMQKAFFQARYKYGIDPNNFQVKAPNSYCTPHDRDPDDDSAWNDFLPYHWGDIKMYFYYGPFNFEIWDTVDTWTVHLAGGIDPHYANELGEEWFEKYDPDTYPKGWSDEDILWKNNILRTAGISDMVDGYAKAREIYANDMKIPKLNLVPPAAINIVSGGGKVDIDWSSVSGAVGYNIYRGEGLQEKLLYDKLDSVDATTYAYTDTSARRNFSYYYYVTAVDEDGIESSHYTVRPLFPATPFSSQGADLADVRVVPNPFVWGQGGYGEGAEDRITFAGLPGPCKIIIYSLTGDIIDEIDHAVQNGSYQWDGRSKFNQFIASGVYIYSVESTEGKGSKIGKFIVIR